MLIESEIKKIRDKLTTCKRPFFIFDGDADGVCSFLLFYRFIKEGKGYILKNSSKVGGSNLIREIKNYNPDVVFVLDVPVVLQEFLDEMEVPVYWIDHHMPLEREGVYYFNPRKRDLGAYIPTSVLCYQIVEEDIWISMIGAVADWHIPFFKDEFCKQYPELFDSSIDKPEDALYKTKVGKLARIISFIIKGKSNPAMQAIKYIVDIKEPLEILEGTTEKGDYILKKFLAVNERYEAILNESIKKAPKGKVFLCTYYDEKYSFTSDLATELIAKFPKKIVVVCREKEGRIHCSLRSRDMPVLDVLEEALKGINGTGGGHEYACGAIIESEDFDLFINNLKKEVGD